VCDDENERMSDTTTSPRRTALPMAVTGAVLVAAAVVLGVLLAARSNAPFAVDSWWNNVLVDWASPTLTVIARILDAIGGGWFGVYVVPLGVTAVLFLVRRFWSALFFFAATVISAGAVQLLKSIFGRPRPEEILLAADYGSFPSGHTANAATMAVALVVIFPSVWAVVAGAVWTVAMAFSRTFAHAHWLSDTFGGALLGAGIALLVAAAFTVLLARDRARRRERAEARLTA
jgi:membrane-associated phospholipid phosphatase